jgi:hypothetical protein
MILLANSGGLVNETGRIRNIRKVSLGFFRLFRLFRLFRILKAISVTPL